jgi:hypothetical protein
MSDERNCRDKRLREWMMSTRDVFVMVIHFAAVGWNDARERNEDDAEWMGVIERL